MARTKRTKANLVTHRCHARKKYPEVDALIRKSRWEAHVAVIVGISYGCAQAIVHDDLVYHKICPRWVTKQADSSVSNRKAYFR